MEKWHCSSQPQHDNGVGFDRFRGMSITVLPQLKTTFSLFFTTHTHTCTSLSTGLSLHSRTPLIEMEECCGRSKCLQMTRLEWIGSRALVMLLHLHQTERKTDGFQHWQTAGCYRQMFRRKHKAMGCNDIKRNKPVRIYILLFPLLIGVVYTYCWLPFDSLIFNVWQSCHIFWTA